MSTGEKMISVLMRSHNDIRYIQATVEALLAQVVDEEVGMMSCDDHSIDGTAEYLAGIKAIRCLLPPEGKYVPGKTLNFMVTHAKGKYIVFHNGDAIPQHQEYLQRLVAPLKSNAVDCVFGRQVARHDALAVVRKDYERAFGDGSIARTWNNFFSLVSSGFRREDLLHYPFDETFQYSEDAEWVNRRKVKIVYVKDAVVEHSHNYSLKDVEVRFCHEGIADTQMGKRPPGLLRVLLSIAAETFRDWQYMIVHGEFQEFFYAPRYRYVQKMSYYRGAKQ